MPCFSQSARHFAMQARRCFTSPVIGTSIDRYKIADIEAGGRPRRLVPRRGARDSFRAGRRTGASSATRGRECFAYGDRRGWAKPNYVRLRRGRSHLAIGSDKMMAAVAAARHTVLKPLSQALVHRGICVDQLADAMHDEGNLRAMPATPARSGYRQAEPIVFSCFNQDQVTRQRRFRRARCPGVCRRTQCRKNSPRSGSSTACTPRAADAKLASGGGIVGVYRAGITAAPRPPHRSCRWRAYRKGSSAGPARRYRAGAAAPSPPYRRSGCRGCRNWRNRIWHRS